MSISKKEAKKARENHKHDVLMAKIEKEFKTYDLNNNGVLEKDEFLLFVKKVAGKAGQDNSCATNILFDDIFRDCDTDQDGAISLDEFLKHYGKYCATF